MLRVKSKTVVLTFLLILVWILCAFVEDNSYLLNWLGILVFVYAVCTWHWEKEESIFCLYTIFFLFLFIFNYGQCAMWALGIGVDRGVGHGVVAYGTGIVPDEQQMVQVKWYTCICMLAFHMGALLFTRTKRTVKRHWYESVSSLADKKRLFLIGCCITIVVAPYAIVTKFAEVAVAVTYGYNALYYGQYAMQSGYGQIIMYLFFPGLICLLIGSSFSKKVTWIVCAIFGLYALLGIASGDRGSWIYSLIILIWVFMKHKGIRWSKLMKWAVVAIIGLYILQVITSARDGGGLSDLTIDDFLNAFNTEESPIVDAFFEMGGTMSILTFFLIKGNGIYPYANTYLTAILGALSSRLISLFGLEPILIADWFSQDYLGITWGTGFSMFAEAYVNGGYFGGIIYVILLGIVIGKLLCMCSQGTDLDKRPVNSFIAISAANIIMGLPRGAVYLILKNFVYGIGVILIVLLIMKRKNKGSIYVE